MPSRVRRAFVRCPVPPSVAVQLQQLSSSYTSWRFIAASPSPPHCRAQSCSSQPARSHSTCVKALSGLPRSRSAATNVRLVHALNASHSPPFFSCSFSSASRAPSILTASAATADTATAVPRILSPTLPSDSPAFSLKKWLSHKLGYTKHRPIIRLYAALSQHANSPAFALPNTTAIPACPSTACALLTLHMWVLNARLRGMAADAWQSGREADAKRLHANIRLLFNLAWQEMEHTLAGDSDDQQPPADSELPSHYTLNEYQQLSYGAMVSYDRAWLQYRETGQRGGLMGALWRNVWTAAVPLHTAHLHALATYVEQAVQLSNRWTERDIAVSGAVQWPVLSVDQHSEASELLRYDSRLYDGSRVSAEESVGVPMRLWESDDDDLLLVDRRRKQRDRLEGDTRRAQQLPSANSGGKKRSAE